MERGPCALRRRMRGRRFVLVGIVAVSACSPARAIPVPLRHDAYVWQRAWTGAVIHSVAGAPAELAGLRVLSLEVDRRGHPAWPAIDVGALVSAGRPVIAVVRIDGSRPIADLSLAPLLDRLAVWRAAGVEVAGVEIDHDCATAALASYAAWLEVARPPPPLRWSITALPTWAGAGELRRVAAAVDELVVQVHAVTAPQVFDTAQARAWLDRFAAAVPGRPLRVALPTYRVDVGGTARIAEPTEVARLLRGLERAPVAGLRGAVWFRLPVDGDTAAWSVSTLRAVIAGAPLAPEVRAALVVRGPDTFDIVLANDGAVDAPWPDLRIGGAPAALDLHGYAIAADRWVAPQRSLRAGTRTIVGWATGKDVVIDAL